MGEGGFQQTKKVSVHLEELLGGFSFPFPSTLPP